MLLSMDKNGNIYQAASHRPDGKGVETIPTLSGGGDVTLESVYAQAESKRQADNKLLDLYNAQEKLNQEVLSKAKGMGAMRQHLHNKQVLKTHFNPHAQKVLLEEAVLQQMHGADFDMLDPINGYGKTASGQKGKSSQTKAIEAAMLQSMGQAQIVDQGLVHSLDDDEKEQYLLSIETERAKIEKAQRDLAAQQMTISTTQPDAKAESLPPLYADPSIKTSNAASVHLAKKDDSDKLLKYALAAGVLFVLFRRK